MVNQNKDPWVCGGVVCLRASHVCLGVCRGPVVLEGLLILASGTAVKLSVGHVKY